LGRIPVDWDPSEDPDWEEPWNLVWRAWPTESSNEDRLAYPFLPL